jgi:hypothetical protein
MASEPDQSVKAVEDRMVPDDLLQKLHQANLRFHDAKLQLDAAMVGSEFRHQDRVDQAEEELRLAERDVEQVTMEIHGALKPPPAVEPKH